MKSLKNREENYFINAEGKNIFELTLHEAINKKGIESEITIQDQLTGEIKRGTMILNKNAYNNQIGVEYHSRWCFYYIDRKGSHFIADYDKEKNKVCFQSGLPYYNDEKEAIEKALINNNIWRFYGNGK